MNNLDNITEISPSDININIPSSANNAYVCNNIKLVLSDIQKLINSNEIIYNNFVTSDLYNLLYLLNETRYKLIKDSK
jgi:hypothetical protein